ncbi:MAG: hypothetical protein DWQ02_03840 [Bacteroidetes bacterium]|nr:MAG: hypothetical protein DWQ02_03840 [Bacteroidota bacterium]
MNNSTHFFRIALTFLLLPLTILSFGQQGNVNVMAEKVLVKSFNLHTTEVVSLELGEPIDVQTWSKSTVRIQLNIALANGTETTLKSLVQSGKYNLKYRIEDGVYVIYGPDLRKQYEVGNALLKENVSVTVFVPENVLVLMPEGTNEPESL